MVHAFPAAAVRVCRVTAADDLRGDLGWRRAAWPVMSD
jgi:hypothetical protein